MTPKFSQFFDEQHQHHLFLFYLFHVYNYSKSSNLQRRFVSRQAVLAIIALRNKANFVGLGVLVLVIIMKKKGLAE